MTDNPLSKDAQLERAATSKYYCATTGEYKGKCPCRPCIGRRARRKGKRAEKKWRDRRQIRTTIAQAAVGEEAWRDVVRWEVKSGARVAGPVATRYLACEAQAAGNKAIGDPRLFGGAVFRPDGMGDELVVIRGSRLMEVARLLVEGNE